MKKSVKILLLALMCLISWYGGYLHATNDLPPVETLYVSNEPESFDLDDTLADHTDDFFTAYTEYTNKEQIPSDMHESATEPVYVTYTGKKYHTYGCRYLNKSCIETTLDDANNFYEPCSRCHPPR